MASTKAGGRASSGCVHAASASLSSSLGTSSIASDAVSVLGSSLEVSHLPARAALADEEDLRRQQPEQQPDFDAGRYLLWHKRALLQRQRCGAGRSHEMAKLYSFWGTFLLDNFNEPMLDAFKRYAEEDAAAGHTHGLSCLFHFYLRYLISQEFEAELYKDFEALALRYQDYLDFHEGMDCLLRFLESVSSSATGTSSTSSTSGSGSAAHPNNKHVRTNSISTTSNNGSEPQAPSASEGSSALDTASLVDPTMAAGIAETTTTTANSSESPSRSDSRGTTPPPPPLQPSPGATLPFLAGAATSSGGGAIAAAAALRSHSLERPQHVSTAVQQQQDASAGEDVDEVEADVLLLGPFESEQEQAPPRHPTTGRAIAASLGRAAAAAATVVPPAAAAAAPSSRQLTTMVLVGPSNPGSRVVVDSRVLQQLHSRQQQRAAVADACLDLGSDSWPMSSSLGGFGSDACASDLAAAALTDASARDTPQPTPAFAPAVPGPSGRRANRRAGGRAGSAASGNSKLAAALAAGAGANGGSGMPLGGGVSALMTYLAADGAAAGSHPGQPVSEPLASSNHHHARVAGSSPCRGPAQNHSATPAGGVGGGGGGGKGGKGAQRSASASGRQQARALLAAASAVVAGVVGGPAAAASKQQGRHGRHHASSQQPPQHSGGMSPMMGSSPAASAVLAAAAHGQQQQQQGRRGLRTSLSMPIGSRNGGESGHAGSSRHTSAASTSAGRAPGNGSAARGTSGRIRGVRFGTEDGGSRRFGSSASSTAAAAVAEVVERWEPPTRSKSGRVLVDDVSVWEAQPCRASCGAAAELASALPLRLGELFGD